ncbi:hypothetical protein BMH32_04145 [Leucobacter sp. OLJS4]|uniref:hypothetical protein n=1 Tax=unclassified Leucobacter TaxID=2621730 RepID=UPI000C18D23B|nr:MULTISPECIES: hypothetical protein [unclassified Leucobacter]PIJ55369.1 hypothetical protein BMH30_01110 [Leucobacter sp. OLES1]PII82275.1 hypothetical protein BMH25_10295 [Leucobacter sp. OLCALW19]PII88561.1 hypothetical protein BMH26_05805 [Leucobacter sp. OLTLW20]PII94132.1 hypothetical protein BMH27_01665 [Leucobacter sp. OLAS13]PII98294.1 hypothetical protein BMH29_09035 [Leucobacter sp. OLDS2]
MELSSLVTVLVGFVTLGATLGGMILTTSRRSEGRLTHRIDGLEHRIDAVGTALGHVDVRLTAQIREVETALTNRVDAVETKLTKRIDRAENRFGARFDRVDDRLFALAAHASPLDFSHPEQLGPEPRSA